jgi:hypothetical protein
VKDKQVKKRKKGKNCVKEIKILKNLKVYA